MGIRRTIRGAEIRIRMPLCGDTTDQKIAPGGKGAWGESQRAKPPPRRAGGFVFFSES